jgi:hypothetical protein
MRTYASPLRSRRPQFSACGRWLRTRLALEAVKKQVEGELVFACPSLARSTCLGSAPILCFSFMIFKLADRPR